MINNKKSNKFLIWIKQLFCSHENKYDVFTRKLSAYGKVKKYYCPDCDKEYENIELS